MKNVPNSELEFFITVYFHEILTIFSTNVIILYLSSSIRCYKIPNVMTSWDVKLEVGMSFSNIVHYSALS